MANQIRINDAGRSVVQQAVRRTVAEAVKPAATFRSAFVQSTFTPAQPKLLDLRGGSGPQNPYNDSDEFQHALHSSYDRFGPLRTGELQTVIDQVQSGGQPTLSTAVPQAGDVMVWGPNAGGASVGQADAAGHIGVVESVSVHGNTVTLRVSERNWDNRDGDTNGVPYRDIDLPLNADGTVSLPNGVGFVPLNNPPLGPNAPIHKDGFQIDRTPAHDPHRSYADASGTNPLNNYTGCVGYIHDMPQFGPLMEQLASTQPNHYLKAANIPTNSTEPKVGELMVWGVGAGDGNVGTSTGPDGHVAYVEDVQKNYDPPGDPNGRLVSYTITVSQANGSGTGNDDRSVRTFTVPANADGQAALPANVGFYDPGTTSTAGTAPATGGTASSGQPIARGSTYTVQQNDTLWSIATRAGVTVDQLVSANPSLAANPDFLSLGQQLRIP